MKKQISLAQYALCMGVSIGLILALVSLLERIPSMANIVSLLRFVTTIFATIFVVKRFKDHWNDGILSSGRIFRFTLMMFVYIGIIAAVYNYVSISYFPTETLTVTMESISEAYSENGIDIDPDQLWAMIPYISAITIFIGHIIFGLILGGIYGATMKSNISE